MALSRWSFLELVQRSCKRLNAPRPSSLGAAELARNDLFTDLIDVHNDVIQQLMLRLWPDELYGEDVIRSRMVESGTATLVNDSATVIIPKASLTQYADSFDTTTQLIMSVDSAEGVYELSSPTEANPTTWTATMDRTWTGETIIDTPIKVGSRVATLPSDFHRMRSGVSSVTDGNQIPIINSAQFEGLKLSDSSMDVRNLSPGIPRYARILRSEENRYLALYPSPDGVKDIYIPYFKQIVAFSAGVDTASTFYVPIPPQHQHIIVEAVVVQVLSGQLSTEEQNARYTMAMRKLNQSIADITAEPNAARDDTRMEPVTYRGRRRMWADTRLSSARRSDDDWEY